MGEVDSGFETGLDQGGGEAIDLVGRERGHRWAAARGRNPAKHAQAGLEAGRDEAR